MNFVLPRQKKTFNFRDAIMLHETFLRVAYIYVHIYTYGHTYIKEKERNSTSSAPLVMHQPLGQSRAPGGNIFLYNTLPPEEFNKSETSGFLWFTFPFQSRQKPQKDPQTCLIFFWETSPPLHPWQKAKKQPQPIHLPSHVPSKRGGAGGKITFSATPIFWSFFCFLPNKIVKFS